MHCTTLSKHTFGDSWGDDSSRGGGGGGGGDASGDDLLYDFRLRRRRRCFLLLHNGLGEGRTLLRQLGHRASQLSLHRLPGTNVDDSAMETRNVRDGNIKKKTLSGGNER